jgi:hypothetical protein
MPVTAGIITDYLSRAGIDVTVSGASGLQFGNFRFALPATGAANGTADGAAGGISQNAAEDTAGNAADGTIEDAADGAAGGIPQNATEDTAGNAAGDTIEGAANGSADDTADSARTDDISDSLYFVKAKDVRLINERGISAIVAADAPECAPADSKCLIRADCSEQQLLSTVQDCFAEVNGWIIELYKAIAAGEPLKALLELSSPVMHNPILIDDPGYKTLALSGRYKESEFFDSEYAFQFESGYHSAEYVSQMLNSTFAPRAADLSPRPIILSFDFLAHRTLYSAVKTDGEVVAFFSMIELETTFTEGLADLCGIFTKALSLAFPKQPGGAPRFKQKRFTDDLFMSIFTERVTDIKTIREVFAQTRLAEGAHFIAYIKIDEGSPALNPFLMSRIVELLSTRLESCHAVLDGAHIILIVRSSESENAKERIVKINSEFFRNFCPVTGFSIDFSDLEEAPLYYRQAKAAADLGPLALPKGDAFHYSQIIAYDLLNRLPSDAERRALCHPAIHILLKHDEEKGGKLIPTLRTVIECAGDTATVAKKLFLHRNSVYYRMNQIVKLTGVNIQDEDVREHLHISMRVIDIIGARRGR